MADKEVSELTAASALAAADMLHIVQGGNSRRATMAQMKAFHKEGWAYFVDAATALEANAVTIPANTRTQFTVDAGAGSITSYVNGSGIEWTANAHRGQAIGDSFTWRLTMRLKKSGGGSAVYALIDQDISAAGDGSNIISAGEVALRNDTVSHPFNVVFPGYALTTHAANGSRFFITATAQIQVFAKTIFIRKDFTAPTA